MSIIQSVDMNPLAAVCITLASFSVISAENIYVKILNSSVVSSGPSDVHLSTDAELAKFGLTLADVRACHKKRWPIANGPEIDAVGYKNPIKCGNVQEDSYENFGIEPVRTSIHFTGGTVLSHTSRPEVLKTQDCVNDRSNANMTCKFTISAKRSNSITTSWTDKLDVAGGVSISIGVEGVFGYGGGLELTSGWDRSESNQETTEIGTELSSETIALPLSTLRAHLVSEVGTMTVKLDYEASVTGQVYECHVNRRLNSLVTTWSDVTKIQKCAREDQRKFRGTQMVTIKVYSRASLTVNEVGKR